MVADTAKGGADLVVGEQRERPPPLSVLAVVIVTSIGVAVLVARSWIAERAKTVGDAHHPVVRIAGWRVAHGQDRGQRPTPSAWRMGGLLALTSGLRVVRALLAVVERAIPLVLEPLLLGFLLLL